MSSALSLPPLYVALIDLEELEATLVAGRKSAPNVPIGAGTLWIDVKSAAPLLGMSRRSLDRLINQLPANQRPAVQPSNGKGLRKRYGWHGVEELRAWWAGVTERTPERAVKHSPPKKKARQGEAGPVDWSDVVKRRPKTPA